MSLYCMATGHVTCECAPAATGGSCSTAAVQWTSVSTGFFISVMCDDPVSHTGNQTPEAELIPHTVPGNTDASVPPTSHHCSGGAERRETNTGFTMTLDNVGLMGQISSHRGAECSHE